MSMMIGARGLSAEMNVTPFVDVLLVLIIIFMITPRTDPRGLETEIPQPAQAATPAPPKDHNIVLRVTERDSVIMVRINQEDVAWADLRGRVRDIYKTRATKVMFIHADKQVEFSHVARAMDLAREADPQIAIGLLTREIGAD